VTKKCDFGCGRDATLKSGKLAVCDECAYNDYHPVPRLEDVVTLDGPLDGEEI
jgi:hypothetical protein